MWRPRRGAARAVRARDGEAGLAQPPRPRAVGGLGAPAHAGPAVVGHAAEQDLPAPDEQPGGAAAAIDQDVVRAGADVGDDEPGDDVVAGTSAARARPPRVGGRPAPQVRRGEVPPSASAPSVQRAPDSR